MSAFLLVIMFIWGGYEALKHYSAEKYANKIVYGKNTPFFEFMLSNHPIITITTIIVLFFIFLSLIIS